ncbi:MAG: xanthine dehydrogenase family protein subunit M [Candidatus Acidiferrales bacterium]
MAREPGVWRPFAGGTDLMVLFEAGKLEHQDYLNLWHFSELRGIEETPEFIRIGALTTYSKILAHATLRREFPLLCRAAAETGSAATQNRGTIGGNIANASPAADSPPALLVYDAELELISTAGSRWVAYHGFHSGYKMMDLRPTELIRTIRIPRNKVEWRQHYRKVGARRAQAISKVCFAGAADVDGGQIRDVRIALGSVAPIVLRCTKTEDLLRGRTISPELIQAARDALAREISPIDDIRSTARYRSRVAQNLLEDFLVGLGERS